MKLVVGLGNPGRRYRDTRHNVGYMVLAELASRTGASSAKKKFQGEVVEVRLGSGPVTLLSPTTYMNRSGTSVREARAFYKLPLEDVLIICDDLNLPLGQLRLRRSGSAGGQKGLADIINKLGDEAVPRLRIGIGSPPEGWDGADFVLGTFSRREREEVEPAIRRAADAVADWVASGIDECMNRYN
jgi:PTH1 family peptidyl-tRNA hydrolase